MSTLRNLLIDFGGVLIDLDKPRCMGNFRRLGIDGLESLLQSCHQQGFLLDFEKGNLPKEAFFAHIRGLIGEKPRHFPPEATALPGKGEALYAKSRGADLPSNEAIAEAWNSFLDGVPRYKLRQLRQLKKTYRILLLSNTNELHWEWAERHDFTQGGHTPADYFDDIFLSFRLHLAKPAPEIFAEVIRQSGIRPEETLFIDDSLANCRAAEAFGIRTFTPQERTDWVPQLFPGLGHTP